MDLKPICHSALASLLCLVTSTVTQAQNNGALPVWRVNEEDVTKLGPRFADSRINISLPNGLKKVEQPGPPEFAEAGIHLYAWTPDGSLPSLKSIVVTLLAPPKATSETLDDFIAGLKTSMEKGFDKVEFSEIQSGSFNGNEVRYGEFRAESAGEGLVAYYFVGIDKSGTFSLTAMLPRVEATHEVVQAFKTSLFSFRRAK